MVQYNKNIQKFIIDNNINVNYFQDNNEAILFNKYDINRVIASWGIYKNKKQVKVSIADIKGKSMHKSRNILLELNALFDETADKYQKRSLSMLKYNKDNIINGLKYSFYKDFITLIEIEKGNYVIKDNGMHRCSLIRTYYLNELSKCNELNKIKKLKNKYTIIAILEKLDVIKTYSSYLLYLINKDIIIEQELDMNYRKTNKVILKDKSGIRNILSDKQLIEYLKKNICSISLGNVKNNILEIYEKDKYFKKFIDENLKEIVINNL